MPLCNCLSRLRLFRSQNVLSFAIIFLSFSFVTKPLSAQTTNIAIGTTVIQPSVKRLGINLGTLDFWDSGQTTQNLVMQNPGFEGQIWNSTIRCMSGTATSCVDDDQWSGWPAGFWNGATFEFIYGTAAGRTGVVTSSTAAGNGQGVTLNFSSSGTAPAVGDYVIVRRTVPGGSTGGWWPSTTGAGSITDNLTDLPPGTLGKQTVALSAPSAYDSATLSGFFDTVAGKTFLQLNGSYQLQFKAKGTGGSYQANVLIGRAGVANYVNQPVTLSGSWNTYNLTFTAAENGSAIGNAGVTFSTVGADSFELDDVSLVQTNGDPTNNTTFRDPVVKALRTLQPGILRYWGGQLGDTLDNLLTPQFGRQRAGYSAFATGQYSIDYGLHEFLVLCQTIGTEPWFVVPTTFNTTDASNLIEYLAGSSTTTYGAKRKALGQFAPWTSVFSKIHLEFANEAWNSTFKGGDIEYPGPYGSRAQTIFGVMRANASYNAGAFDLVLGGQASYAGRNSTIQNGCNNNDSFTVAPYTMNNINSYTDNESLYGPTFAEPEAFMSATGTAEGTTPGMVYQDYQAIQSSSHPVPLSYYEINLSTLGGSISQQALNSYTPSLGAGLMVVDTMLQSLRQFGVVNQMLFALPQYSFNRTDGKSVLLWGSVVDMGVTDRRRPQYLALQLANQALSNGGAMLQTVHTGADPTWNQALVNTVQFNGAHDLQSYAFSQGTSRSVVVFNFSRTSALPVTFSGANAPSGSVQMQQLTSANPTDTNENSNVVTITPSTLNNFNPSSGLSLPPYSMTVLTWGGVASTPSAPVISAVGTSAITTTSALVTWTTDQPSSSQVQFGTSSAYGGTSALNSALVTAHSVALTGLQAGTTYNFEVSSVNSAGGSSTSANFTFVTVAAPVAPVPAPPNNPPPQISSVEAWGIHDTSMTVTWSSNEPATTALAYGTTPSLGQITPIQTSLGVSHGVTLTGLTPGTTYYLVAQSADSSGNTGYSTTSTATTSNSLGAPIVTPPTAPVVPPPQITGLVAWGIHDTSMTVTWSSNEPATTALAYGVTPSLGQVTPVQSSAVLSHGVTLSGLTPGTTYYLMAQSADSTGNTGYSALATATTSNSLAGGGGTTAPSAAPPVLTDIIAWGIQDTGMTVTWSSNEPASTALAYGTTPLLGQMTPLQSPLVSGHGVALTGLTPGTTYYLVAQSSDASGNVGYSAMITATTSNSAVTSHSVTPPPYITDLVAWGVHDTSATLTWSTNEPATGAVAFGVNASLGQVTPIQAALTSSHGVTLTGLNAGATYYVVAQSADGSGNTGYSSVYQFTTTNVGVP